MGKHSLATHLTLAINAKLQQGLSSYADRFFGVCLGMFHVESIFAESSWPSLAI